MDVKENSFRVLLFAFVCCVVDALAVLIFGGGSQTAFISTLAVGIGYAYGRFQAMYIAKKIFAETLKKLSDSE